MLCLSLRDSSSQYARRALKPKPPNQTKNLAHVRDFAAGNEDQIEAPKTSALVVVPTRELALQVKEQFLKLYLNKSLKVLVLYGGADFLGQSHALKRGADIIIATPGRLIDFLMRGACVLNDVNMVVLDEADPVSWIWALQYKSIKFSSDYLPVEDCCFLVPLSTNVLTLSPVLISKTPTQSKSILDASNPRPSSNTSTISKKEKKKPSCSN